MSIKNKTILFVANNPGGANAILPIYKKLNKKNKCEVISTLNSYFIFQSCHYSVFYLNNGSSRERFWNFCPLIAVNIIFFNYNRIFLFGPFIFFYCWIQMIIPSITTLFSIFILNRVKNVLEEISNILIKWEYNRNEQYVK